MASPVKDKKPAPLPAPNSDFYELLETLPAEELAVVKQVRAFMETKDCAHHHQVLGRRCFPIRNPARAERTQHWRRRHAGIWLQGRKCAAIRLDRHGDGALRLVDRDILRSAQRFGDGFDLPGRVGRTKTEMAPPDGSLGNNRLLRPNRTTSRVRSSRRAVDDCQAGRRHLDHQWSEEVDRQLSLVRYFHHLGSRRNGQPG